MKKLFLFLFLLPFTTFSQDRNSVWCFGDSAGIDFSNVNNPVPIFTGMDSRGSCSSICDSIGNLLFYVANSPEPITIGNALAGKVYNSQHQVMSNGDSLYSFEWYNEIIIISNPASDSLYFVFTIGVTPFYGIYYSLIDLSQNSGLGAVTQKNIQLQSFANTDCLNAIKHGNGRDWWVIFRESGVFPGGPNNQFYQYLITPNGISNLITQSLGSINATNNAKISFSPLGNKMSFSNYKGLIELYDFDRCTGTISNSIMIHPEDAALPIHHFFGSEFSSNGNVLYLTISDQNSYLFQFDLTAPNIWSSIDTLWHTSFPGEAIGGLKRGPDGKIYESGPYTNPTVFVYPYPDSMRNVYNENLGVINYPDSLGAACDFQPYSFYLGGKRTYWGLPNNPDYELGPLVGSLCDTITGLSPNPSPKRGEQSLRFLSRWLGKVVCQCSKYKGRNGLLQIYNVEGKLIYEYLCPPSGVGGPYFTQDVSLQGISKGMYLVRLETEKEKLVKKFVKD